MPKFKNKEFLGIFNFEIYLKYLLTLWKKLIKEEIDLDVELCTKRL